MSVPAVSPVQPQRRSIRRRLMMLASGVILLLLIILLPPYINIGRYRHSIAGVISRSMGRPVHIDGVQLRLLPMPGIEMSGFEVEEDPAFGAEPALRASTVVATLRLSSLWRGRLEVSRISLEDASLNLVRNSEGRWSIGSVLDQATHLSNAPTAQRRPGSSPRFPYIEATDARINFKEGLEKKPFSLMNAEFSMWLDTPDQWRVRLKAQPARTDLDPSLSDAGELTVEGSMHRAADLSAMPVNLDAEWRGAQLGQVSRLLIASDIGWRGDLDISAALTGNIRELHIKSRIRIANAHRQEFAPAVPVDIDARCESDSLPAMRAFDNLTCFWPVGSGHLLLTGNLRGPGLQHPRGGEAGSDLKLEINRVPASLAANMIGLMRQRAGNVIATGAINGEFEYTVAGTETQTAKSTPTAESLTGQATVEGASLLYPGLDRPLQLPSLHFTASPPVVIPRQRSHAKSLPSLPPMPASIVLQSFPVAFGADSTLNVGGSFSRSGFSLHFSGQAAFDRLLPVSREFGLMQPSLRMIDAQSGSPGPQSSMGLDLSVQAPWLVPVADQQHPELAAVTLGSAQIRNVQVKTEFLSVPLEISSATVALAPSTVAWNNVSAIFQHIPLHGSASYPVSCTGPAACPVEFMLDTNSLDAATAQSALMGAGDHGELLDAILARMGGQHHAWPALNGTIHIAALQMGGLPLRNVVASITVADTALRIASFDAASLGGALHAAGSMDAAASQPAWKLDVQFSRVSAADLAALFHEHWGTGIMSADARFTAQGFRADRLASSANGTIHFDWQNGNLPALAPAPGLPLPRFDRWTGDGTIEKSTFVLAHSRISHGSQTAAVSGTISFQRALALQMETDSSSFSLAGSLVHPLNLTAQPRAASLQTTSH